MIAQSVGAFLETDDVGMLVIKIMQEFIELYGIRSILYATSVVGHNPKGMVGGCMGIAQHIEGTVTADAAKTEQHAH